MLYALFVILGASLWATDTLFRHPLVSQFSPVTLVLVEHMIATGFSFVIAVATLLYHSKRNSFPWKKFFPSSLLMFSGVAWIGILGSAIATVLFTYSFQYVNPTVSILLQKTQPLVVLGFSALLLNEKLPKYFSLFALLAFISAYFLSFPNGFHWEELQSADSKGVVLALAAAVFWAISTVIGKVVMSGEGHMRSSVLSFWRFLFGLFGMAIMYRFSAQSQIELPFITVDSKIIESITYMALVPGLLGVSLYYKGLARVPASVATILELSFPLCALVINSVVLKLPLQWVQLLGAAGLMAAMISLSLSQRKLNR